MCAGGSRRTPHPTRTPGPVGNMEHASTRPAASADAGSGLSAPPGCWMAKLRVEPSSRRPAHEKHSPRWQSEGGQLYRPPAPRASRASSTLSACRTPSRSTSVSPSSSTSTVCHRRCPPVGGGVGRVPPSPPALPSTLPPLMRVTRRCASASLPRHPQTAWTMSIRRKADTLIGKDARLARPLVDHAWRRKEEGLLLLLASIDVRRFLPSAPPVVVYPSGWQ